MKRFAPLFVLTALFAGSVNAQTACVRVDEKLDNLSSEERHASRLVVAQVLKEEGRTVSLENEKCDEMYTISSVRLGKSITSTVTGPQGTRSGQASRIDELSSVFSQITKSLTRGSSQAVLDRQNVLENQMAPKRQPSEDFTYVSLGYGFVLADGNVRDGPALAVGHRWELDRIAISPEGGLFTSNILYNAIHDPNDPWGIGFWVLCRLSYFFKPLENNTFYAGGGPGFSTIFIQQPAGPDSTGLGFMGNLHAGYEFLRSSTLRIFFQFDVNLPVYFNQSGGEDSFTPMFLWSVGVGKGRSPTETKRTIIHD